MEKDGSAVVPNDERDDVNEVKEQNETSNNVKPVSDPRLKNNNNITANNTDSTTQFKVDQETDKDHLKQDNDDDEETSPSIERDGTVGVVKWKLRRLSGDIQPPTIPIEMIANLKLKGNDKETKELLERDPRLTQYSKPTLKTLDLNFADKLVDPRNQQKLMDGKHKKITSPPAFNSLIFSSPPLPNKSFTLPHIITKTPPLIMSPICNNIMSPPFARGNSEVSCFFIFTKKLF